MSDHDSREPTADHDPRDVTADSDDREVGADPDGDHYVYVLECADGSLYTGYTTDVERQCRHLAQVLG